MPGRTSKKNSHNKANILNRKAAFQACSVRESLEEAGLTDKIRVGADVSQKARVLKLHKK